MEKPNNAPLAGLKKSLREIHGWKFEKMEPAGVEEVVSHPRVLVTHDRPQACFRIDAEKLYTAVLAKRKTTGVVQKEALAALMARPQTRATMLAGVKRDLQEAVQAYSAGISSDEIKGRQRLPVIDLEEFVEKGGLLFWKKERLCVRLKVGIARVLGRDSPDSTSFRPPRPDYP